MNKGICPQKTAYFGLVTVTDKGQIAVPVELRHELKINKGDKLVVVKRKDGQGLNLLKAEAISDFIAKLSQD